ncbi:hypothetical protein IMZ11_11725 [Microtetraspora sp. AC03309]|uniref:hypothetical protein n=1 Tax=Microtetraspora sp. AC03309 TaxID=2779376 RepID=UPI001E486597|nr:hypothetical protein [Microtetraspora sp. AC03309]MCC5576301.1 hypothetical protein [Microtetraspora sp. AC03309]
MNLEREGEAEDRRTAELAATQRRRLLENAVGDPIVIANEFAEIRVVCVREHGCCQIRQR